jgi:hypothetical protein
MLVSSLSGLKISRSAQQFVRFDAGKLTFNPHADKFFTVTAP